MPSVGRITWAALFLQIEHILRDLPGWVLTYVPTGRDNECLRLYSYLGDESNVVTLKNLMSSFRCQKEVCSPWKGAF